MNLFPIALLTILFPPQTLKPDFKADVVMKANYTSDAPSLDILIRHSPLIVIGRASRILKHAHKPENSHSFSQYSVYEFQVERFLKGQCPEAIKLHQVGGPLEWSFAGTKGSGYKVSNNPLYFLGERYILFLREPEISPEERKQGYLVGSQGTTIGKMGALDEYYLTFPQKSKILLKSNQTALPMPDMEESEIKFREGAQIIGLTEASAIRLITQLL